MTTKEELQDTRIRLRNDISQFPVIIESEPVNWWRQTARMLIGMRRKIDNYPILEVREYMQQCNQTALEMLRKSSKKTAEGDDQVVSLAEHMMMDLSMEMATRFEPKELKIETHFIPLEEIVKNQPDRFATEDRVINGVDCVILKVKHPINDDWQEIPLPKNEKIWHKGGPARAVLDIIAGAPISMQASEFPWNDFDVIVAISKGIMEVAKAIGVDSDGIEYMGEDNINFIRFCFGRDTQQNQVCIGAEGIYFSQAALMSAKTGHVNIVGEYMANKAIYGIDRMRIQGVSMAKQRGLMRLVKAVSEGKALSFDYLPINANFDMGIYTLFLAKRWSKKENFNQNLQKMYYLLKQMGQVRDGEKDIFQVLNRAMDENPFFDFDKEVRTPIEVTRWKSRKIVKQLDREMAWLFGFPSSLEIQRKPGDDVPNRISLDGFNGTENDNDFEKKWSRFVRRSRRISKKFYEQEISSYDRIFAVGYEDTEDLGVGFDDLFGLDDD